MEVVAFERLVARRGVVGFDTRGVVVVIDV
jgi:hypothetical protein